MGRGLQKSELLRNEAKGGGMRGVPGSFWCGPPPLQSMWRTACLCLTSDSFSFLRWNFCVFRTEHKYHLDGQRSECGNLHRPFLFPPNVAAVDIKIRIELPPLMACKRKLETFSSKSRERTRDSAAFCKEKQGYRGCSRPFCKLGALHPGSCPLFKSVPLRYF